MNSSESLRVGNDKAGVGWNSAEASKCPSPSHTGVLAPALVGLPLRRRGSWPPVTPRSPSVASPTQEAVEWSAPLLPLIPLILILGLCAYTPRADRERDRTFMQKTWKIVDVVRYGPYDVGILWQEMGKPENVRWERPAKIYRRPE